MNDLKSTKTWHIQNLIQVDDDCQVVLLCDALALEKERDELAAQVERLRGAITPKVIDLIRCGIGSNYSGPLFDNTMNEYREPLVLALSETLPPHWQN